VQDEIGRATLKKLGQKLAERDSRATMLINPDDFTGYLRVGQGQRPPSPSDDELH
jgi:hypothetical protein